MEVQRYIDTIVSVRVPRGGQIRLLKQQNKEPAVKKCAQMHILRDLFQSYLNHVMICKGPIFC